MRSWSMLAAVLAIVAAGVASVAVAEQPKALSSSPGQAEESYDALVREALTEFNAGNFAEARALFERAHAQKPNARTLRGLGITSFELKRYVQSLSELDAALGDSRNPLTETQRSEVQALMAKAHRFVGKIKLDVKPSGAKIFVDAQPASGPELLLDLGSYRILVRAAGYRDAELKLVVDGGEDTTQHVELVPIELSPERAAATTEANGVGLSQADHARDDDRRGVGDSVFGKWWFWTGVGAVVVSGTIVALAVALNGHTVQEPLYQGTAGSLRGP